MLCALCAYCLTQLRWSRFKRKSKKLESNKRQVKVSKMMIQRKNKKNCLIKAKVPQFKLTKKWIYKMIMIKYVKTERNIILLN